MDAIDDVAAIDATTGPTTAAITVTPGPIITANDTAADATGKAAAIDATTGPTAAAITVTPGPIITASDTAADATGEAAAIDATTGPTAAAITVTPEPIITASDPAPDATCEAAAIDATTGPTAAAITVTPEPIITASDTAPDATCEAAAIDATTGPTAAAITVTPGPIITASDTAADAIGEAAAINATTDPTVAAITVTPGTREIIEEFQDDTADGTLGGNVDSFLLWWIFQIRHPKTAISFSIRRILLQCVNNKQEKCFQILKELIFVVLLKIVNAALTLIAKKGIEAGMSTLVFVAFRIFLAWLVITPVALYRQWSTRPTMTCTVFWKIVGLSVLGPILEQDLYYWGMRYSNATLAAALGNIIPAMTFVLAVMLRLEELDITNIRSLAKVVGTVAAIGGALVMALVKGPVLFGTAGGQSQSRHDDGAHPLVGAGLLLISYAGGAVYPILQNNIVRTYDARLLIYSMVFLLGAIETAVVAVLFEERYKSSAWTISGWNRKLVSILFAAVIVSGLGTFLAVPISKGKGPIYSNTFNPLTMVIVAIFVCFIFKLEPMVLGSMVGAIIIIVGLFFFVWGKKSNKRREDVEEAV